MAWSYHDMDGFEPRASPHVTLRVSAQPHSTLPRLAWLARLQRSSARVEVIHGCDVEVGPGFVVEGVWDAPFTDLAFDESDNFFGTGLLIGEGALTMVPSRALVDRVLWCEIGGATYISNSLPLLLAGSGARLDATHSYNRESFTSLRGIHAYDPNFHLIDATGAPVSAEQRYHHPLTVDLTGERREGVDAAVPHFTDFDDYWDYLTGVIGRIEDNARSPARRKPLSLRTTTSSGYDSTAVTVLLKETGDAVTYTRRRSNSRLPRWLRPDAAIDDGSPIAEPLGYQVRDLAPASDVSADHERYLLAATTAEPEVALHSLASELESEDRPTALFTGYHGDKVWDRSTEGRYLETDLLRGDTSGLNLSEIRLTAGFVNVAVPFIGARAIRDLVRISNHDEMRPWQVGNDYDRPIPRRIVESAGIPRAAFGVRKKAVVQRYSFPWHPALRKEFLHWLESRYEIGPRRALLSVSFNGLQLIGRRIFQKSLGLVGVSLPDPVNRFGVSAQLPELLHLWAVESLADEFDGVRDALSADMEP